MATATAPSAASSSSSVGLSGRAAAASSLLSSFAVRSGLASLAATPSQASQQPITRDTPAWGAGAPANQVDALLKAQEIRQQKRYLWTDAFAVCGFLSLASISPTPSAAARHRRLALSTIQAVHESLGHFRPDDAKGRSGWLRGPYGAAEDEHPTRAGLRIGKEKAERPAGTLHREREREEWERDGQYFHYLSKWMHALDLAARATNNPKFNLWARELAVTAQKAFVHKPPHGAKRMYWKMSTDLSYPLVSSMGQHDALDGFITAAQLEHTYKLMQTGETAREEKKEEREAEEKESGKGRGRAGSATEGPDLSGVMAEYEKILRGISSDWSTSDPLGLGGLLVDAWRVEQMQHAKHEIPSLGVDLLESLLSAAAHGLRAYSREWESDAPAEFRLAFRELGLAIGLAAVERMQDAMENGRFAGSDGAKQKLNAVAKYMHMRQEIEEFWMEPTNRQAESWKGHENINAVMLATALVPQGFLDFAPIDPQALKGLEEAEKEMEVGEEEKIPQEDVVMRQEPKPSAPPPARAPRVPALARPALSDAHLHALRQAALPIDVERVLSTAPRSFSQPLPPPPEWLNKLIQSIGDAPVVLIGEATHGTEEFYRIRCLISQYLIAYHGFDFVIAEADFPDMQRLNRYVQHRETNDRSAEDALQDFKRFPTWMWRNHAVAEFAEWLRGFNQAKQQQWATERREAERRGEGEESRRSNPPMAGIHGLDLYSLFSSAHEVLRYLRNRDPEAAERARRHYSSLLGFGEDVQQYGFSVMLGLVESQQQKVVAVLKSLLQKGMDYLRGKGPNGDELVNSKFNAKVVQDAEKYYRASMQRGINTWNLRDAHMVDTLIAMMQVYSDRKREAFGVAEHGTAAHRALQSSSQSVAREVLEAAPRFQSKCIVWAHNSHLGDARETERTDRDEFNVGQLVREKFGQQHTFNIGFSTWDGTVSAATSWGGERQTMSVNPGLAEGYEQAMHEVAYRHPGEDMPGFQLIFRSNNQHVPPSDEAARILRAPARLQRAIGVQYVKRTERWSHYFRAVLPRQFDALLHIDRTRALEPLLSAEEEMEVESEAEDMGARPASQEEIVED